MFLGNRSRQYLWFMIDKKLLFNQIYLQDISRKRQSKDVYRKTIEIPQWARILRLIAF